ncbi:phage baseplate plug family protein [Exiguobacterium sp. R-39]|uniref:phage baseplate plug family protein n=1 Tax=Exiguobacterium sp. R-39 TaxID=3416708 RepID=UPI003CF86E67
MELAKEVYDIIPIDKESLPERFDIDLGDEPFTMQANYNETGDFFTIDLFKTGDEGEDVDFIMGEKLVLGRALWADVPRVDLPAPTLIPLDIGMKAKRVSFDNFGESVFLYIADGSGEDDNVDDGTD